MTILGVLLLNFSLEAGYLPTFYRAWDGVADARPRYYTDLGVDLQFADNWFLKANEKVYMLTPSLNGFSPIQGDYTIEAGITVGGFTAGVSHECIHPISSIGVDGEYLTDFIYGGNNRIYVRFDTRLTKP